MKKLYLVLIYTDEEVRHGIYTDSFEDGTNIKRFFNWNKREIESLKIFTTQKAQTEYVKQQVKNIEFIKKGE